MINEDKEQRIGLDAQEVKKHISTMDKGKTHITENFHTHITKEKLRHWCQIKLTSYGPSFPTCLSHPRKCAPSLVNSPSVALLPFWALATGQTGSLRAM
jgi:hypothetical protein